MPDHLSPSALDLARENEELRQQLREAEELIAAVRTGAVDALAIQGSDGPRIFTLEGADHAYRILIEQMSEGALLLSSEGMVLYSNAALASLLHAPLKEVLATGFERFIPAEFRPYWAGLLAHGWASRARGELPLLGQDGLLRPCAVSMNALVFNGGEALAVLVTDLAAQREIAGIRAVVKEQNALLAAKNEELQRQQAARQAVEQAAAEASRILEGIPQIAFTATPQGKNSYLNRRWYDFAGEGSGDPDRPITSLFHPDDAPQALAVWARSLAEGLPLDVECRIRSRTGEYRWMLGRALPSVDEQGHVMQWIGTFTDIHAHKLDLARIDQAQQQLRENNEQLTRVNVDLDNFVYAASHDLKQPVNNIEGLLQTLVDDLPAGQPAPVNEILGMMSHSVERFKRTVEQLTDITKVQREAAAPVLVSVADVVRAVQLDLDLLIKEAEAQVEIGELTCPPVSFLEKNLRSVVYNLLSNALKYRDPARPLRVQLTAELVPSGYVRLAVQDNGLGLDVASQQKLFGMFQRLHNHVEGTGIGLYMVKKIVENAGGRVEVSSELGVGSTFAVYLLPPAAANAPASQ